MTTSIYNDIFLPIQFDIILRLFEIDNARIYLFLKVIFYTSFQISSKIANLCYSFLENCFSKNKKDFDAFISFLYSIYRYSKTYNIKNLYRLVYIFKYDGDFYLGIIIVEIFFNIAKKEKCFIIYDYIIFRLIKI